jgi:hypothetical protein
MRPWRIQQDVAGGEILQVVTAACGPCGIHDENA